MPERVDPKALKKNHLKKLMGLRLNKKFLIDSSKDMVEYPKYEGYS